MALSLAAPVVLFFSLKRKELFCSFLFKKLKHRTERIQSSTQKWKRDESFGLPSSKGVVLTKGVERTTVPSKKKAFFFFFFDIVVNVDNASQL